MEEAGVQLEEPEMTAIEKFAARRNSKTEKPSEIGRDRAQHGVDPSRAGRFAGSWGQDALGFRGEAEESGRRGRPILWAA